MNTELATTPDRMKRPERFTDDDWEVFKYELSTRQFTLADYEAFLEATDSTLEEEYAIAKNLLPYYADGVQDLVIAMEHYQRQAADRAVRLAFAKDLAYDLLADYYHPLQAELHKYELAEVLLHHDDDVVDKFLKVSPKEELDTREFIKGVFLVRLDYSGNPLRILDDGYGNANLNLLKAFVLDKTKEVAA